MARALRASVALSALALSAFAGVAAAAPKADNPKAGPPPAATDPCLDIVDGFGRYVIHPDATVPGPNGDLIVAHTGTLTFEMDVAAPSCVKGHYTLNVFSQAVTALDTGVTVVPPQQIGAATEAGTGTSYINNQGKTMYPVYFTVDTTDYSLLLPTVDKSNPCVGVQGVTAGTGGTADVAPDSGTVTVCTVTPALSSFH